MSGDASTLIGHHEWLWSQQANHRSLWNLTAQFVLPSWDNFLGEFAEGVNRNTRLFDSTAVSANERFAAAMEWMLTPRTQKWHGLAPTDEELEDDQEVQAWCDAVTKILFASRYRPKANYASQTDECYMSLGAFGNNALLIDELVGRGLYYRSIPLNEVVWALDHSGMVDTVFRKFRFSAKQAVNQWKDKADKTAKEQLERNPYAENEYLHCVRPNDEYKHGEPGAKGMRYESWYIALKDKSVIERGGYRSFPYAIGRYRMSPREHYGRGPASLALPHVRTLNEMAKTALRAGQKAVDPPLLLAEEGALTPFNMRPGALNYGMLTADGAPLAVPLETGKNLPEIKDFMEREGASINDSFLVSLFQILVQNPQMTATEALIRAQEKGAMIAPAMGRQQSEFLGPQIARELDIHDRAGLLPPPPRQLVENGKGIRVEYVSPLTRAMRAEEGTAIMNTVQSIGQMMQIDPSVKNILDITEAAREMALIQGCPAKLLRTAEQIDEIMQSDAKAQQQQQMAASAPGLSQSALNLAKAQQAFAGTPQGGPGNAPAQAAA